MFVAPLLHLLLLRTVSDGGVGVLTMMRHPLGI